MKKIDVKSMAIKGAHYGLGFVILLVIYFIGDFISTWIPFPVPGSVIGLLLLFFLLYFKVIRLKWVDSAATLLLTFLGLFYVPYGVGIIEVNEEVKMHAGIIVLIVAIVLVTVLFFSGKLFTFLGQKKEEEDV